MIYPAMVTIAQVMEKYAPQGTNDGIQVYNEKGRSVGYITDLKVKFSQEHNAKAKQRKTNEKRQKDVGEVAQEMHDFLKSELPNGLVFINETMPNVDINGVRYYVMCGTSIDNSRINIKHAEYNVNDINDALTGYEAKSCDDNDRAIKRNHVMISGLSKQDVLNVLTQLGDKL